MNNTRTHQSAREDTASITRIVPLTVSRIKTSIYPTLAMLESAELQLVVMLLPPSLSLENRVGHAHGGQVLVPYSGCSRAQAELERHE